MRWLVPSIVLFSLVVAVGCEAGDDGECGGERGVVLSPVVAPDGETYYLPSGYTLSDDDWNWELPDRDSFSDSIRADIDFRSEGILDREALVRLAQSIYPPDEDGLNRNGGPDGQWWTLGSGPDPERNALGACPGLATRGALRHFAEAMTEAAATAQPAINPETGEPDPSQDAHGELSYQTRLGWRPDFCYGNECFTEVYVIVIEFDWHWFCGNLCGYGMEYPLNRTVVVTRDGHVLAVFDTEAGSCWIS